LDSNKIPEAVPRFLRRSSPGRPRGGAITGAPEGDGRRQRSQRTRARIIEAATELFVGRGFNATTVEDIAGGAGVVAQTVYSAFGSKPKLLAAVLDARIAGDDQPIPVAERPWVESLADAADAGTAIAALAAGAAGIFARVAPVYDVLRGAASDRDVAALLEANRRGRRQDQRRLAQLLADAGHLNPDLDVDAAADVIYALVNEDVFLLLTVDCGWDLDRYREWLTTVLVDQLTGR
jgi:AcrR family transcriptional regulator